MSSHHDPATESGGESEKPPPRRRGLPRQRQGPGESFADLLRATRIAHGLTQDECATRAGIGVRTLRDLERGNARPQQATVDLLVGALELAGAERDRLIGASGRAATAPGPVVNLPPLPTLIGREADVISLVEALRRRTFVTLVGLAGVGKTSLAIAVAHRAAPAYPGGTSAVVITEVSTETDILMAIAGVFDVGKESELPKRFADRDALLMVDGFERAPGPARAALDRLAAIAPTLHIIATSRHELGANREMTWVVAPLDVPPADADHPDKYPAVELFMARLDSVRRQPLGPSEQAVVGVLVRRLGGLPLALELAAARGRVLDLHEILERYGDRVLDLGGPASVDALPRTLRDAVGESYRLLDPAGRHALRRLASFRHRWSLEMAEPLLADITPDPVAVLDRLVGLGLVQILGSGPVRFRMLDVVRDFSVEQRDAAGETAAAAAAHATVITAGALRIAPDLVGSGFLGAVRRLDDIGSDIRAALDHAVVAAPLTALSLAAALPRWWRFRGRDRDGRATLRALLDSPATAGADPAIRAWAQLGALLLAHEHGEAQAELPSARDALVTFAALDDVTGQLAAHTQMVALYHSEGAYDLARQHGAAALALASRAGRRRDVLVASTNLTWHDIRTGDLAAARQRLTALRKLAGELGEDRLASLALANLTEVERLDRRYDEAVATGQRAVALLEQHGDPRHRRSVQCTVATALAEARRLDEARAMLETLRIPGDEPDGRISMIEAYLALGAHDNVAASGYFADARHTLVGQPDVRDVVEALVGFASTASDPAEAAAARAELARVCETSAVTLLPRDTELLAGAF